MRHALFLSLLVPFAFAGCGGGAGAAGDACEADEDCEEGLHCDTDAEEPVCVEHEHTDSGATMEM